MFGRTPHRKIIQTVDADTCFGAIWHMPDRNKAAMGAIVEMIVFEIKGGGTPIFHDGLHDILAVADPLSRDTRRGAAPDAPIPAPAADSMAFSSSPALAPTTRRAPDFRPVQPQLRPTGQIAFHTCRKTGSEPPTNPAIPQLYKGHRMTTVFHAANTPEDATGAAPGCRQQTS